MPIYEYACESCNHRFEVRQGFHDDTLSVCPECTGRIRRVMHPAGVIFKGSGWYSTDNRTDSGSSNGKSESSASESKKDDSKPESSKKEPAKSETTKPEKAAAED